MRCFAQGEASTYFNVFVPPNAEPIKRNVCLIVTAVFDDTNFEIVDDGADGDTDDSKSGVLSAGQSYILYIADNGINDDARYASGGVLKQDGDYFFVRSNKNVLVSQSTNSDWQHDFVPSISQKGIGERFIVYAPQVSSSKRDLNAFVYNDSTLVTIKRITTIPTTTTGYTNVDYQNAVTVGSQLLNRGQDLIYYSSLGRDVMETGHTYMVESSKPIALQYGALYGNERDGGGNVPSGNGSSAGDLFYFAVPYQSSGEQEIRIVSWDDVNNVKLERYNNGSWVAMKNWTLSKYGFSDWVGKSNGNSSFPTIFRVSCTTGKRVSIFEANWLETGNPGTSDIGSMMTSENGTTAGKKFIAYIAPPGNEYNVRDPFSGTTFNQQLSHLYISSRVGAHVTVKDAYTNGVDFSRTFDIQPERYVDCSVTIADWKNIYNGTGTTAGGVERPYLVVESDNPVSVFNTNFNDNWMAYLGTSQPQAMSLGTMAPSSAIIPGDTSVVVTSVALKTQDLITDPSAFVSVEGNVKIVSSTFSSSSGDSVQATISNDYHTAIYTSLPDLTPGSTYTITTEIVATVDNTNGTLSLGNSVGTITTAVTGTVDGVTLQSVSSEGIFVNSSDQSQMMFTHSSDAIWNDITNSWSTNLIDYNNDGWDDVFITEGNKSAANYLFRNNGSKSFTKITSGPLVKDFGPSMSSSWSDIDNDGDIDVVVANNTTTSNFLYLGNGDGTFSRNNKASFTKEAGYYQNASWVDYDNDGLVDLFLCNYWPTKLNELWHNDGNGVFSLQSENLLSQIQGDAASAAWYDYDNDGLVDLFLPNNKGGKNILIHNEGNGRFSRVESPISAEGGYSVAACWGDINEDGLPDLFVSNASGKNNYLYINSDTGFKKIISGHVVNDGGHSHGCSFADVDNDADIDLYVTNDHGEKFLYINDGLGNFTRKLNETITVDYGKSMGHAWADLDRDGDLDLFTATHSDQKNHLFWNNGYGNNWIQIKLFGTVSNYSAVGSRVRVKANGKWQSRQVVSQSGIGGQSSYRVHLGLGKATIVDSLIVYWPSGSTQVITNQVVNQFINVTEQVSGRLSAYFFADANDDCAWTDSELDAKGVKLKIEPGNLIVATDDNGKVDVNLAPGSYTLSVLPSEKYARSCSVDMPFIIDGVNSSVDLGRVGLKPMCNCADAEVKLYTTVLRRGFGNDYFAEVSNTGVTVLNDVSLKLSFPSKLDISSSYPEWQSKHSSNNNTVYQWNLDSLEPGRSAIINVRDSVSLAYQVGEEVFVSAVVSGNGENNVDNNSFTDINTVVGAIDPNYMAATPIGLGDEHFVDNLKPLTYKVYFENTGNYKSSFVVITDTLSHLLDGSSITKVVSSHGEVVMRVSNNVVTFKIDAELSPLNTDSTGAQGFLQFTIMPVANVAGILTNRASIVFDYNEPISTNAVSHTLVGRDSTDVDELLIFPNPVTNEGQLTLLVHPQHERSTIISNVELLTLSGVVVRRMSMDSSLAQIDTYGLEEGLYVVQAVSDDGHIYRAKLIIN